MSNPIARSQNQENKYNLYEQDYHLLKYKYQLSKRSNSWRATIREHRLRIKEAFQDSPSLKRYFDEVFDECYQNARAIAADETGLEIATFNTQCLFSKVEVMDSDFLPEAFD